MGKYFFLNSHFRNFIKFPKTKYTIKILCDDPFEPFIHQQCFNFGIFNNVKYVTSGNADLIIVLNKFHKIENYVNDGIPIFLWLIEPPDYIDLYIRNVNLNIFDKIFTSKYLYGIDSCKQIITPPFVHWHHAYNSKSRFLYNGILPFKNLIHNNIKNKLEKVFILDSHINNIPGHQLRINFIESITNLNFDLYGSPLWNNHNLYKDKLNSFKFNIQEKYKYSLVIENQYDDIYWSEKITDSYLANSFPIYYGSKSIKDFFPEGSYYSLNNLSPTATDLNYLLSNVNDIIDNEALFEARNLVLFKYNIFNIFSNLL